MEMKVDVDAVLRSRAPGYHKWIPRPLIKGLEKYICQERLNELLEITAGLRGAEFCHKLLEEMQVTTRFEDMPELDAVHPNQVTYACNHPLGALDGIALIEYLTKRHGVEPYFVVNDLLSILKPLDGVFIPINKHGAQSRGAVSDVDAAFHDVSRPVVMFPAGLCSRKGKDGEIRDLKWNKMFVNKSAETGRKIIPLRCFSENSPSFYRFAKMRENLGIKFNMEMIALPREFVHSQGKVLEFRAGKPIAANLLPKGSAAMAMAAGIRDHVYSLEPLS
ncbi:MAG: hypothetical protein HDR79_10500 [Bacteroides sp.]|nr:hypothetical protein [Bacteroides sp.]MBD5365355.1 hypothetical protein [Bacteroides sp.]